MSSIFIAKITKTQSASKPLWESELVLTCDETLFCISHLFSEPGNDVKTPKKDRTREVPSDYLQCAY